MMQVVLMEVFNSNWGLCVEVWTFFQPVEENYRF